MFQGSNTTSITCHICSRKILKSSLANHLKSHNIDYDSYGAICVDITYGIYLVNAGKLGTQKPIHVKKQLFGEHFGVRCSNGECEAAFAAMIRGGQPAWDCHHSKALSSCPPYEAPEELDERHLIELQQQSIISESSAAKDAEISQSTPQPSVVTVFKQDK